MPKYFTQLKAEWFSPEHPAAGPNRRILDFVQMLYQIGADIPKTENPSVCHHSRFSFFFVSKRKGSETPQ
jgi:hypothetical protein